jgi:uncharacterized protein YgbK (DUF1537 family)
MIVIADDLTGANDTGVQFVKQGQETVVYLTSSHDDFFYNNKVSVINTDCRSLSPEEAYKRTRELARKLNRTPQPFIYKKVDSTLRGNIGREIDGLMDELSFTYCAVVPAYPMNGRVTIGGYHLVRGSLLEDTELSKDVKFPMKNSFIPSLLAEQSNRKIGLVTIETIRRGEIAKEVRALRDEGIELIVFDSATDADLKAITAFLETEEKVLWVGSAALAQAFTENKQMLTKEKKAITPLQATENDLEVRPTLTIAGSVSKVTREQIAYQKEQGAYLISIHPLHLLKDEEHEMERYFEEAKKALGHDEDVVITTSVAKEVKEEVFQYTSKVGMDNLDLGNGIASKLGKFGSRLIREVEVSGLILTGGDIAYQTCLQLGINALEVVEEIEEGIPLSRVIEGDYAKTLVVTKAGAFGYQQSLHQAMNVIKTKKILRGI